MLRYAAASLIALPALAQDCLLETQKVVAERGGFIEAFAHTLEIDGQTLLIGCSSEDVFGVGTNAGSVRVYQKTGGIWSFQQILIEQNGTSYRKFGESVGAHGDTALIGEMGFPGGIVRVFRRVEGVWEQHESIQVADTHVFGMATDYDGAHAIVGDPALFTQVPGAAYIFSETEEGWTLVDTLVAGDPSPIDSFGRKVAIEGDIAVIGAETAAYVFERVDGDWVQTAKLTPVADAIVENFPMAVAISDGVIVVGTPEDDQKGNYAGAAFIYEKVDGAWTQVDKLTASDGTMTDYFGASVAMDGQTIVVGAYGDNVAGHFSGSAYVYEAGDEIGKITPSDAQAGDFFGYATAVQDGAAVIGAVWADGFGAAYAFDVTCDCPADCNADGSLDILDFVCFQNLFVAGDLAADCDANGALNVLDFVCFQNAFVTGCK